MSKLLPNGTGETLGDDLVTASPLQVGANIWYVQSTNGTDAASPAGRDKEKPLATLAQAQTNAAAGDVIVLLSGHTETYTAALTISKQLTIVASGQSAGKPTVKFYINAAAAGLFIISTTGVELRNIYFPAAVQSNTNANGKVYINASDTTIRGCYFEQSGLDQLAAVNIAAGLSGVRIENTTFISTATSVATRPTVALSTAGTSTALALNGAVFSDGTVGYSTAACDLSAGIISFLRAENVSLLLGSDLKMNASSTGYLNVATSTGGASVAW